MADLTQKIVAKAEAYDDVVTAQKLAGTERLVARNKVRDQFRRDLEVLHGFADDRGILIRDAKADLLWTHAWREGHSEGFHRVADIYAELVPLLKD